MDELGMGARAIEDLIYKQSGLLDVSGISSDMRSLLASDDERACFAVELFTYRSAREAIRLFLPMPTRVAPTDHPDVGCAKIFPSMTIRKDPVCPDCRDAAVMKTTSFPASISKPGDVRTL